MGDYTEKGYMRSMNNKMLQDGENIISGGGAGLRPKYYSPVSR
jgi:hypothetical protein